MQIMFIPPLSNEFVRGMNIQWAKKTVSSTNGVGKTGQQHAKARN